MVSVYDLRVCWIYFLGFFGIFYFHKWEKCPIFKFSSKKVMQPKKTSKNHFCEHYAANSLFYKSSSVLFIFGHFFGQKKCPFSKNFLTLFFFILA